MSVSSKHSKNDISCDFGTLTVRGVNLTITSDSAQKVYNGKPLKCDQWQVSGDELLEGHSLKVLITGERTEVGSSPNSFEVSITDTFGKDCSAYYEITSSEGTLTVLERNSDKNNYGGSGGSDGSGDSGNPENVQILSGSGFSRLNTSMNDSRNILLLTIYSVKTEHVYLRNCSYGNYTGNGWNAAPIYNYGNSVTPLIYSARTLKGTLPATYIVIEREPGCPYLVPYYTTNGYDNAVGDVYAECTDMNYHTNYMSYAYNSSDSVSMSNNEFQLTEAYRNYVYDTYLTVPKNIREIISDIGMSNNISMGDANIVEEIADCISQYGKYNSKFSYPDNVDVIEYFLTVAKEGICQQFASAATLMFRAYGIPARYTTGVAVTTRAGEYKNVYGNSAHAWVEIYIDRIGWVYVDVTPGGSGGGENEGEDEFDIVINSYSASKEYDGTELTCEKYRISKGAFRYGHKISSVTYFGAITDVGIVENQVKIVITDESGSDVTETYSIGCKCGILEVTKRRVVVCSPNAEKIWDGNPLTASRWWISEGSLASGHTISVYVIGSRTPLGSSANIISQVIITDANGKDVSSFYNIEKRQGTLSVR